MEQHDEASPNRLVSEIPKCDMPHDRVQDHIAKVQRTLFWEEVAAPSQAERLVHLRHNFHITRIVSANCQEILVQLFGHLEILFNVIFVLVRGTTKNHMREYSEKEFLPIFVRESIVEFAFLHQNCFTYEVVYWHALEIFLYSTRNVASVADSPNVLKLIEEVHVHCAGQDLGSRQRNLIGIDNPHLAYMGQDPKIFFVGEKGSQHVRYIFRCNILFDAKFGQAHLVTKAPFVKELTKGITL